MAKATTTWSAMRTGVAIIGDKRNDENIIVSQLQLIFLKFHNAVVDSADGTFDEAQRLVRWHYQWVVVHDWLKRLCGDEARRQTSSAGQAAPESRSSAPTNSTTIRSCRSSSRSRAYRLGHSMLRGRYKINQDRPGLADCSPSRRTAIRSAISAAFVRCPRTGPSTGASSSTLRAIQARKRNLQFSRKTRQTSDQSRHPRCRTRSPSPSPTRVRLRSRARSHSAICVRSWQSRPSVGTDRRAPDGREAA